MVVLCFFGTFRGFIQIRVAVWITEIIGGIGIVGERLEPGSVPYQKFLACHSELFELSCNISPSLPLQSVILPRCPFWSKHYVRFPVGNRSESDLRTLFSSKYHPKCYYQSLILYFCPFQAINILPSITFKWLLRPLILLVKLSKKDNRKTIKKPGIISTNSSCRNKQLV